MPFRWDLARVKVVLPFRLQSDLMGMKWADLSVFDPAVPPGNLVHVFPIFVAVAVILSASKG